MPAEVRRRTGTLAGDVVETCRRGAPDNVLPLLVSARAHLAWAVPSVRAEALRQMAFLLERSRPEADLAEAARGYVAEMARRAELRWHPRLATAVRVEGAEHLLDAVGLGRGVVLSFMHHGLYDRGFPAVARTGVAPYLMVHPYMLREDTPRWLKQHVRLNSIGGGRPVSTEIGSTGMARLLGGGAVVAIASDVPGRTRVGFAGRTVLGSSGAARIAVRTGSPVVLMTSERDAEGERLRLHAGLDPVGSGSPEALLARMLTVHERAVLAWPEAGDLPMSRWGAVDDSAEVR